MSNDVRCPFLPEIILFNANLACFQEAHSLSDEEHTREVTALKAEMAAYEVDG